jgi:hypothetical protein
MKTKEEINIAFIPIIQRKNGITSIIAHTVVDAEDVVWLGEYNWYMRGGYAVMTIGSKMYSMARMIMGLRRGSERQIDHQNGIRLDNRKSNLRICTHTQNARNAKKIEYRNNKKTTSKYRGVSWDSTNKRWLVTIRHGGCNINIGSFSEGMEKEAGLKYNEYARKWHKQFCRLNVI